MRRAALLSLAVLCSCSFRTGYGLEDSGTATHDHQSEETAGQQASGREPEGTHHVHAAGEHSVCTEWLFTQPWASRGDWPRIARDSGILLGLSLAVRLAKRTNRR
jgi:hypothetical protein